MRQSFNAVGAEYKHTETQFLVPYTGHASRKVYGAAFEFRLEGTQVATFELLNPQARLA
jgi:hypothetical protein